MRQVKQPPDADNDCDVDLGDFSEFSLCFMGVNNPVPVYCLPWDFDADGDVDLGDFATFNLAFTGTLIDACPFDPCEATETARMSAPSNEDLMEEIAEDSVRAELCQQLEAYCKEHAIPFP